MPCDGPVHLRRAVPADAPGIAEVHVRSWQKTHAALVPPEFAACLSAKRREGFWRGEIEVAAPGRGPWAALLDERIVGFASAGLSRDDDATPETGEVYHVIVHPECWGRGIGRNLLSHVLRDLTQHGFGVATFWVLSGNSSARRFAEKQGWRTDGGQRFEDCGGTQVPQVRYRRELS